MREIIILRGKYTERGDQTESERYGRENYMGRGLYRSERQLNGDGTTQGRIIHGEETKRERTRKRIKTESIYRQREGGT